MNKKKCPGFFPPLAHDDHYVDRCENVMYTEGILGRGFKVEIEKLYDITFIYENTIS